MSEIAPSYDKDLNNIHALFHGFSSSDFHSTQFIWSIRINYKPRSMLSHETADSAILTQAQMPLKLWSTDCFKTLTVISYTYLSSSSVWYHSPVWILPSRSVLLQLHGSSLANLWSSSSWGTKHGLKVRPHRTRFAAADCGLCPLRNVTF